MDPAAAIPPEALADLPVFPLTNVVLVPGMVLPLNVFEPRYVRLVDDLAEGHGYLGVPLVLDPARAMDAAPRLSEVFGVGRMTSYHPLPDGRRFVRVQGLGRVRARSEHSTSGPYRTFSVDPLPEPPLVNATLREILLVQLERIAATLDEQGREIVHMMSKIPDARLLAYAVTAILPGLGLSVPEMDEGGRDRCPHLWAQQRSLEAESTDQRFHVLIEHTGVITGMLGESGRFPRLMFN